MVLKVGVIYTITYNGKKLRAIYIGENEEAAQLFMEAGYRKSTLLVDKGDPAIKIRKARISMF